MPSAKLPFVPGYVSAFLAMGLALTAGGCSFFPSQGPDAYYTQSSKDANPDKVQYVQVELTPAVLSFLKDASLPSLSQVFGNKRPPPELRLGIGDIVAVTIFEAAAGGLFIPSDAGSRAGNFVTLPNQEIDSKGFISVPYAGEVPAAGRTLDEVKSTINDRLKNRAIEPQAVVSLVDGRSSQISVTGEVNSSERFTLTKAGDRLLDAIARAGGNKYPAYETYVTLKRGNRTAKAYMNTIVANDANNLYLYPGDTIVLNREFRSFMPLGASGQNGQINFDNETLTLAQALGKAGGILDARGDPAQTFLYRLEPKKLIAALGHDVTPYITPMVPVIYHINMREPDGLFLASSFQMRDKDILFVANSGASEFAKMLSLFSLGTNSVVDLVAARTAVRGF